MSPNLLGLLRYAIHTFDSSILFIYHLFDDTGGCFLQPKQGWRIQKKMGHFANKDNVEIKFEQSKILHSRAQNILLQPAIEYEPYIEMYAFQSELMQSLTQPDLFLLLCGVLEPTIPRVCKMRVCGFSISNDIFRLLSRTF